MKENNIKFIGKVGNMYVSDVFPNAKKMSLCEDVNEACNLDIIQQNYIKEKLNAKIIKVTILYMEM